MSFLEIEGKSFLIVGVANRKSVAYHVARIIVQEGGLPLFSVQDEQKKVAVEKLFPDTPVFVCDVSDEASVSELAEGIKREERKLDGLLHSVAFANYSHGPVPFHEVDKKDFLHAIDISCFSLVTLANACKGLFTKEASVVTVSISTTRMAAENYGYMGPIKAALDSSLVFLVKSFSQFSEVRFNAVAPSLLKTSASAGIPGYVDSYLFAEKTIPRKRAITTEEAAKTAAYLLSPASSGVNGTKIVVDAGMSLNYFNSETITKTNR